MFDKFKEEWGVFGIFGHNDAARLTNLGLNALQHRGQKSGGMVVGNGEVLRTKHGRGHVDEIFDLEALNLLRGHLAIGHVSSLIPADEGTRGLQPLLTKSRHGLVALCSNGNLLDASNQRVELEQGGAIFSSLSDMEVVLHRLALPGPSNIEHAIIAACGNDDSAYSMLFATPTSLIAIRDPRGFRPLCMGELEDATVFASETCAFDIIDATYVREVSPGEMVTVDADGVRSSRPFSEKPHKHCVFEHVYFSRPDSVVFGRSVNKSRLLMGEALARELPVKADVVVPVPDSGVPAAVGFASESGIPFGFGIVRNHYINRGVIERQSQIRDFGVRIRLNPVPDVIEGKIVVLIDDSIVQGKTSQKIVKMVRDAGAIEVHMRISCPPIIAPCYYGVSTPPKERLIASRKSVEDIRQFLNVESLGFLSMQGMLTAVGDASDTRFCTACYTGVYPTRVPEL